MKEGDSISFEDHYFTPQKVDEEISNGWKALAERRLEQQEQLIREKESLRQEIIRVSDENDILRQFIEEIQIKFNDMINEILRTGDTK